MLVDGDPDASFLRAYGVRSEPPGVVHHAILFVLPSEADVARALDAADEVPGWACYGGPNVPGAELTAVWTPVAPVVSLPEGTGIALPGGPMVVQVHLGAPEARTGTARFEFAATVEHPLAFVPIAAIWFALPPGEDAVTCLVSAPRWNYGWQEVAFYEELVSLLSGTPLELSCTFSTLDLDDTTV